MCIRDSSALVQALDYDAGRLVADEIAAATNEEGKVCLLYTSNNGEFWFSELPVVSKKSRRVLDKAYRQPLVNCTKTGRQFCRMYHLNMK